MADINQLSVPVTSRQHGILEPMRLQIVSNLDGESPHLSVEGEDGGDAPGQELVLNEGLESCSADTSYIGLTLTKATADYGHGLLRCK